MSREDLTAGGVENAQIPNKSGKNTVPTVAALDGKTKTKDCYHVPPWKLNTERHTEFDYV